MEAFIARRIQPLLSRDACVLLLISRAFTHDAKQECHDSHNQENEEQYFRDGYRTRCDSGETENRGDECDHEKIAAFCSMAFSRMDQKRCVQDNCRSSRANSRSVLPVCGCRSEPTNPRRGSHCMIPLRKAYAVMSALLRKLIFSSTRLRYVLTVFTLRHSSSAIPDTDTPAASLQNI